MVRRGVDYKPHFLYGFQQLAQMGLGRNNARAPLERVEALEPFKSTGTAIYQDVTTPQAHAAARDLRVLAAAARFIKLYAFPG